MCSLPLQIRMQKAPDEHECTKVTDEAFTHSNDMAQYRFIIATTTTTTHVFASTHHKLVERPKCSSKREGRLGKQIAVHSHGKLCGRVERQEVPASPWSCS